MFRLSRYFSLASLIGMGIIVVVLTLFFRHQAMQTLLEHQTRANIDLSRSYANAIWSEFAEFVADSQAWSVEELLQRPELKVLEKITLKQMKDMNVVKVKVYNLSGMTVFSTEAKQIGKDQSHNTGFLRARDGGIASEIIFRNEFYAFEKVIVDRDLIATYLPIREQDNGPVKAVFEVYTDVTPLVANINYTQYKIIAGILLSLAILYLFLHLIVKRADKILTEQEKARQENEDRIRHQAFHDSLTGLPNRDSFIEHMGEAVNRAKRHHKNGALMFIDVNRFKLINDSLGHDAGDQLLRITASRIQKSLREIDQAFRLSGDEFVVILEDLEKAEFAATVANRILENMAAPVLLNGCEVIVNISIGITTFPKQDNDIDVLVKEADSAMYRAKQDVHKHYEFYTQDMNTIAYERLEMETDLQRALQQDEFILHYQPKINAETGQPVSVEALLRWKHPQKGIIPPNDFIPLLEDTGLIYDVGEWVINKACRQAQTWIAKGHSPLRMSVNISAKQFRSTSLINTVRKALQNSGLEAKYLELELTESMFVEDTEHAIDTMQQLKALGVSLSIDDFGSGYSSLSYLKQFPVDYLKIDRSFIKDLITNKKDAAITMAILALAHSLNLRLIAEGVEDQAQADFLQQQGCHELQGFYFGYPMRAADLEQTFSQPAHRKTTHASQQV